ncbi:MAG: HEAT repeat domain-containing protein [Actinomycetota bacterium]
MNPLLKNLLLGEIIVLLVIVSLIAGHALLLSFRERRRMVPNRVALDALAMASVGGADARMRAVGLLSRTRRSLRIQALLDVALVVEGRARAELREVADELGITRDAHRLLHHRRWWKRVTGARVLMGLGEAPRVDLLDDERIEVQQVAIAWISEADDPPALDRLVRFAGAAIPLLRFVAQDSLLRLGPTAMPPLRNRLEQLSGIHRPDERQTVEILALLEVAEGMGDPELTEAALPFMSNGSAQVRASAVGVMAAFGGRKNERRAAGALSDIDPLVRAAAARALGSMGAWKNGHVVRDHLSDRDPLVRREAAIALGRMGPVGRILLRDAASWDGPGASLAAQMLEVQGPVGQVTR